jgi:hypothetical protein
LTKAPTPGKNRLVTTVSVCRELVAPATANAERLIRAFAPAIRSLPVRFLVRLGLIGTLLGAAMVTSVAPTFAADSHDTITVTCSNGFTRTVSAHAARGVATSLSKFNAHNHKNVTCAAAPGAPRMPAASFQHVTCTDGFQRDVNARAANAIVKALNAYSARKNLGVTCAIA